MVRGACQVGRSGYNDKTFSMGGVTVGDRHGMVFHSEDEKKKMQTPIYRNKSIYE